MSNFETRLSLAPSCRDLIKKWYLKMSPSTAFVWHVINEFILESAEFVFVMGIEQTAMINAAPSGH